MAGHERAGDELLCESNSNTKKAKRQITKATFEKWQKEHEIEHQMLSWLQCDLDAKGTHMVSLYCAICRKYEANIVDDFRCIFEFPKGGHLPIWSHGTRWVTHKRKALQRVLDRYGAYIHHLSTLTEDSSLKSDDRQHLKGYLLKWRQPKMLIGCAMYWILQVSWRTEGDC